MAFKTVRFMVLLSPESLETKWNAAQCLRPRKSCAATLPDSPWLMDSSHAAIDLDQAARLNGAVEDRPQKSGNRSRGSRPKRRANSSWATT
jgi:hypothetical protein